MSFLLSFLGFLVFYDFFSQSDVSKKRLEVTDVVETVVAVTFRSDGFVLKLSVEVTNFWAEEE